MFAIPCEKLLLISKYKKKVKMNKVIACKMYYETQFKLYYYKQFIIFKKFAYYFILL